MAAMKKTFSTTKNQNGATPLSGGGQVVSVDLLQGIVENFPDPVLVKDRQHRWLFANKAFEAFSGRSAEDVVGQTSCPFFLKDQADLSRQSDEIIFTTENSVRNVEQVVDAHGRIISIVAHKSVYRDGAGKQFLVTVLRSATEAVQEQAYERQVNKILKELALGGSREHILGLILEVAEEQFEGMTASILLVDDDEKKLRLKIASKLPDFFTAVIDGTPVQDGMGSCGTAAFRKERVVAENLQSHPYWHRVKDLTLRANLHACWSEPIIMSQGNVAGTFALYYDRVQAPGANEIKLMETMAQLAAITIEHHQIHEEKALLRKMMANIIDSMPSVLIGVDASGGVTQWNKEAERVTGIEQLAALGKKLGAIYPYFQTQVLDEINYAVKCREVRPNLKNTRSIEGKTLYEDITVYPLTSNGIEGAVIRVDNITERVQLEEAIIQADRMMSIGVLAGGIAHDFNNILVAILGNLNLAAQYLGQETKAFQLVQKAEEASFRAKGLANQLLTFSKGGEPVRRVMTLDTLIKESAQFMLAGSTVRCRYSFPEEFWPVDVDEDQISQVVQNLVVNAKQAMEDGGVIEIRCANVVRGAPDFPLQLQADKCIAVTIRDYGPGIPDEISTQLFDPYFTTKQAGSGLGLAVCYSVISRHGGYITTRKVEGDGAAFIFYLPVEDVKHKANVLPVLEQVARGGHGTVLIMDDDLAVCALLSAMLQHLGYEVVTTHDGTEVLKAYDATSATTPVRLVIMDLTVPAGMGGREAVQKLHATHPDAKVVVTSGYSNDPVLSRCEEHGFCGALAKPFQLEDLAVVLQEVLEN